MRLKDLDLDEVNNILNILICDFPHDWLLSLEICELVDMHSDIYNNAHNHLLNYIEKYPESKKLILDGLNLIK